MHDIKSIFTSPRPVLKRSESHTPSSPRPLARRRYSESTTQRPVQSPDFAIPASPAAIIFSTSSHQASAAAAPSISDAAVPTSVSRPAAGYGHSSPSTAAVNHRQTSLQPLSSPRAQEDAAPQPPPPPPPPPLPPVPNPISGSKRPIEQSSAASPPLRPESADRTIRKRTKRDTYSRRTLGALDLPGLAPPSIPSSPPHPPSPLFFSHSPQPRPALPPRFSSSEAGARMLNRTHGEDQGIKTVTLPRATIGSPPVQRPSHHRSRFSTDRKSGSRITESPDSHDRYDQTSLLNQIGITELLEQDDRPTFIVDLGDPLNHASTALQIVYINATLRLYTSILDCISGRVLSDENFGISPQAYSQFKAWVLAPIPSSDSSQTSFTYGAVSWSISTLRRRIRIVTGNAKPPSLQKVNWTDNPPPELTVQSPSFAIPSTNISGGAIGENGNAQDYFGLAGHMSPTTHKGVTVLPSVELGAAKPDLQLAYKDTGSVASGDLVEGSDIMESVLPTPVLDLSNHREMSTDREVGFFDWTRLPLSDALPPHIRFARSVDWGSTALGPIETWNPDLRQMCNLIMASPHPAAMYWGDDLVAIYNEAYVLLAGQKHPKLMGQSYREAWAEIWDEVKEVFANAQTTGEATMKDDDCLFIKRNDFLEETYFSWSIIPMVGGDGSVMGLYNPAFEKTRRKIAERRMLTLREVGERTATARDVKSFWEEVLNALECNEYDTPFVLLYSLFDDAESDEMSINSLSATSNRQCILEGSLGVPEGHIAAPTSVDFQTTTEGFVPAFREVLKTNKPQVIEVDTDSLPSKLLEGLQWRGFGDAARAVVICPIHPTTGESTLGFLVMGVNPRRPYDDDYNLFVQLLGRQLATSLASVVLFEEEIRRGQRAAKLAALDRIELSEQLAERTAQAIESETKFTRMAEMAPVGMLIADSTGHITFCNDTYYDITRISRSGKGTDQWINYVHDEDRPNVQKLWNDVVVGLKPVSGEFRFKAPWIDRNGLTGSTWVLFSAFPELDDQGMLKSVFGSITNISQQKWAEGLQKRKMEEAVELKRQQENFIDITSHEMRNPLSAILQCADEISASLGDARSKLENQVDASVFDDNIDAAHTITLCAQHQKRIVDDVLTMSKLDSHLLMVTPVDVQPLTVAQRALKMFEGELQTADIHMKFVVHPSFKALNVDWVRFDPSRVLQVLINLTTNAIKFTTTESQRTIVVTLSASIERPSDSAEKIVDYIPNRKLEPELAPTLGWGKGEVLYILFSVQDTGRGLSTEEKKLLFQRFSQASPRTHVQYGGSGLGLFISRELTELQGGQIGVASQSGKGSTFAFFVKARRSAAPAEGVEQSDPAPTRKISLDSKMNAIKTATKARDFAQTASTTKKQSKEHLKVLIVEDNLVNQRVLQKQLKNMGCVTHVANHGGEALDQLQQSWFWSGKEQTGTPISVVLMDQEMPVMDGLTCTRKIRELEKEGKFLTHVPIIAVTANARSEQIKTAMNAGMDDVVSKPFRIPELIPKIEELVERYNIESVGQQAAGTA